MVDRTVGDEHVPKAIDTQRKIAMMVYLKQCQRSQKFKAFPARDRSQMHSCTLYVIRTEQDRRNPGNTDWKGKESALHQISTPPPSSLVSSSVRPNGCQAMGGSGNHIGDARALHDSKFEACTGITVA